MTQELSESAGTVDVRFGIVLGATGMVCETGDGFDAARPAEFSLEDLRGQIELRHRNTAIVVKDDVMYLAWNLCLDVPPRLIAQQACQVDLYLHPSTVRFEPQGEFTLVNFADAEEGSFPTIALARQLVACAQRLAKAFHTWPAMLRTSARLRRPWKKASTK